MSTTTDVIIIGAGAAGLFCAARTAAEGRTVKVLDHANKAGKKILMSGGGRCNFTNYYIEPACYLSQNPHFCKSALSRYTQWDFIDLVSKYDIPFHEKKINIYGNGKYIRDYIYIDDLISGLYIAINKQPMNQIYNIASEEMYSINEIIHLIEKITRRSVKIFYKPHRKVDVKKNILAIGKIKKDNDSPERGVS